MSQILCEDHLQSLPDSPFFEFHRPDSGLSSNIPGIFHALRANPNVVCCQTAQRLLHRQAVASWHQETLQEVIPSVAENTVLLSMSFSNVICSSVTLFYSSCFITRVNSLCTLRASFTLLHKATAFLVSFFIFLKHSRRSRSCI